MARRLLTAFVFALLPVVAVVVHPELRQVVRQDATLLLRGEVDIFALPHDSPERAAILRLESLRGEEGNWQRMEEYARMARDTRQPYLYAAALRRAMQISFHLKSAPMKLPPGVKEIPEPLREWEERRKSVVWRVLAISNEMIALDRDNAFPYLTKMCALFALGQDSDALNMLRAAALCPRYEDYDTALARALAPRELIAESRALATASIVYSHLAHFREAARRVRSLIDQHEKRGEYARALVLRAALASVAAKMRESRGSLLPPLVGISLQQIAWSMGNKRQNEDPVRTIMTTASEFASYARRHGRPDLAESTLREAARSQELRQEVAQYSQRLTAVESPWSDTHVRTLSMRAAGVMLLLWVCAMAFCLGVSLILSPWWKDAMTRPDHLAPVTAALVVAGVFVAIAIAGLLALNGFGKPWEEWLPAQAVGHRVSLADMPEHCRVLYGSTVAVMALLAGVCFTPALVRASRVSSKSWIAWLLACGVPLGLALASMETVLGYVALTGYDVVVYILAAAVIVGGLIGLMASPFYAFVMRKPLPEPFRSGIAALWGLASAVAWRGSPTGTALWFAAGLVLWLIWGRGLPEDARLETQRAVYRFGMSALILAVFGLWLYAVLGYASLPVRAEQHAYFNQLIEHGEMSFL